MKKSYKYWYFKLKKLYEYTYFRMKKSYKYEYFANLAMNKVYNTNKILSICYNNNN